MPEVTLLCGSEELTCAAVSVRAYRKYTEIMEQNEGDDIGRAIRANMLILSEVFGVSLRKIEDAGMVEIMAASKAIHFIMQEVVTPKFLELNPDSPEQVEKEASAFDEYDEENGYNDEDQKESNVWRICRENVDRVVKMCIRVMKNSYDQCMNSDIISLLDYVAFEIRTINEK